MPLNQQHQVDLIKDILSNHRTDCSGSIAECEQLERLVKSLMVNTEINQDVKNILQEIYDYSQYGINARDLNQHIESNQGQLSAWVNGMNELT
ncbi:hypothetical protein CU633_01750 [Bacillus sp. V3-13]|uniref:YtzH-like family protein n=1 Tax=Bacillus sp. V3-13 TaxID=2053728 RepID=UPI000C76F04B|nr:YtzH-like family protein [Bacillus sp. V3-13]PLR79119.1 hypothetical protein CU633_01750 [Bacillus sp. V3-13]